MSKAIVCLGLFVAVIAAELFVPTLSNHHIVVFRPNATREEVKRHVTRHGVNVTFSYEIADSFKAYSAYLTPEQLRRIKIADEVKYTEPDQMAHVSQSCVVQNDAIWGLNRISEKAPLLTGEYDYASLAGEGAEVFVIDTGILITHQEFQTGRALWGANYADTNNNDCNGHGTHVAGTIGGTLYGVAKKTTVIAVKVLGCNGSGTYAGVIKGIDYSAASTNRKGKYAIANMSLGGGYSQAVNDAIAAGTKAGTTFVVAAGNDNRDACLYSPASEASAITVGATVIEDENQIQKDERTYFSNYGSCVKILAPGMMIKAAWNSSPTATNTISGTSMASPHVAGVAALYLAANPVDANPKNVETHVLGTSVSGVIDLVCSNTACLRTPNKMLYSNCA